MTHFMGHVIIKIALALYVAACRSLEQGIGASGKAFIGPTSFAEQ